MPTATGRARPGDIFSIPLGAHVHVAGKVIYASRHFRNVLAVAIADRVHHPPATAPSPTPPGLTLYTGQACAKTRWTFVRCEPVTQLEVARTRRIVAEDVWVADEYVGPVNPRQRRVLPYMAVLGCAAVNTLLREHFHIPPE